MLKSASSSCKLILTEHNWIREEYKYEQRLQEDLRRAQTIAVEELFEKTVGGPAFFPQEGIGESRTIVDYLKFSGYFPRNEHVDMAVLVSLLLKKKGHAAGSEEMMEFVMKGGTVEAFMNAEGAEIT